jgi:hypothetical protein
VEKLEISYYGVMYRIYKDLNTFQVLEEIQLEIPDGFGIISELLNTE